MQSPQWKKVLTTTWPSRSRSNKSVEPWSARREGAFTIVNCTTISDPLLESELFGHVRGAFTGAYKDKPGRLEAADGGTVFLDEIAELPLNLQAKFLRYLQEGCFERVGGQQTTQVDTRIIAATNRNLEEEVSRGSFRADLYYRLNVIKLRVPPLRERPEDILSLAEKSLTESAIRNRRAQLRFAPEAEAALVAHSWPGNLRELSNVVERAAVLSRGRVIRKEDLSEAVFRADGVRAADPYPTVTLEAVEQEHIRRILNLSPTLEEAATTLGIGNATLWRKRKRYHMDWSPSLSIAWSRRFPGLFQFATCTFQSFRDKGAQRFELPLISLETFSRHTLCELG
jgi:two-component system, NtrC family, response regulator AlgB